MADDAARRRSAASGAVPRHVAIIMDGNGRWAQERALPRPLGHRAGMKSVREVVEGALAAGVEVLSLFAFSQENWQRPPAEIEALMSLLEEYIARETEELARRASTVRVLGDLDAAERRPRAPRSDRLDGATARRHEAARSTLPSPTARGPRSRARRAGWPRTWRPARLAPDEVDEEALAARLYTAAWPDPDLLIRTSGEQRISNFLLWQLAYAELYVTPVLWPDFTRQHLFEAILDYQGRERRFGRVTGLSWPRNMMRRDRLRRRRHPGGAGRSVARRLGPRGARGRGRPCSAPASSTTSRSMPACGPCRPGGWRPAPCCRWPPSGPGARPSGCRYRGGDLAGRPVGLASSGS